MAEGCPSCCPDVLLLPVWPASCEACKRSTCTRGMEALAPTFSLSFYLANCAGYSGKVREDIDHRAYMPGVQQACAAHREHAGAMSWATSWRASPGFRIHPPTTLFPLVHLFALAAAWRIDDYLGGEGGEGEEDDDLDLASLRAHRLKFAKDRKDAMSRRWVGSG